MPLMQAYCEFYESSPPDSGVIEMLRTLITIPPRAVHRTRWREAVGVATLDWKWSSLKEHGSDTSRISSWTRTRGRIADALIQVCADRRRELGMPAPGWLTAPDNHRAQKVYNRTGAEPGTYVEYDLEL
jgi:hypothetical protein